MPLEKNDPDGLFTAALRELRQQLVPDKFTSKSKERTVDRISLATFVETTSNIICEPWQTHMCSILESLTHTKGRRILIHKPPQHGGSIIVSQRLPAYLLGDRPDQRVVIATHNIEKSTEFSQINLNIMQSSDYRSIFPDRGLELPFRTSAKKFKTRARMEHRDGQFSINSLGLQTGFVGTGADTLIIDDPYASPQEALSEAVNKSIWVFWTQGAKVRIDDNSNVLIMFHRYHEDDFIGKLIKEEGLHSQGGIWELYSYRAQWDEDERLEVGGPDLMDRKKGEYLSPRKSAQKGYYNEQKRNPQVWLSQYQGKPSAEDGVFFLVTKFKTVRKPPVKLIKVCRSWDIASSEDGDYTVGVKAGLGEDDLIYVLDVIRFRKNTEQRNTKIKRTANVDRILHPDIVTTLPQDPSAAGKDMTRVFTKLLMGHNMKIVPSTHKGAKIQRADPWSSYVNAGYVVLVYDGDVYEKNEDTLENKSWVPAFIEEHRRFNGTSMGKDDQIDASADCFGELALEIDSPPGEDFDTVGLNIGNYIDPYKETEDDLKLELLMGISNTEEEEENEFSDERKIKNGNYASRSSGNVFNEVFTKLDPRARKIKVKIASRDYNFNKSNKYRQERNSRSL